MRSILVPVLGGGADRALLETAGRLARMFGSHIDALHVQRNTIEEVATLTMGAGAISQEIWDRLEADNCRRTEIAKNEFEMFCVDEKLPIVADQIGEAVSASWRNLVGIFKHEIIRVGRTHDLLVVGRAPGSFELNPGDLGEILLKCGRPTLITPHIPQEKPCEVVAVAWKDTPESAHALTAAEPFLARAKRVAGAFGHSRAREFILGGVTRDVLEECPLPVLLTH